MTHLDRLASQHALTLEDPRASGEAILSAMEWIEQNQDHLMAFHRVERFMRACDNVDPGQLADLTPSHVRRRPGLPGFGHRIVALAASVVFLLCVGSLLLWAQGRAQFREVRYATPAGAIRSIHLADGSNITLSGGSSVSVALRRKERTIHLLAGEALFNVSPDRSRPFTVKTENGSVTAIGTAFDVHRAARDTTVTVLHGRVEVLARGEGYVARATLDKAMEVRYSDSGDMGPIRRVDPGLIASWRRGELHFTNTSLASIIDDLNRYSRKPIIIENAALRGIRISGVIDQRAIPEWLGGLPAIADVMIIETQRDIRIRTRPAEKATRV